MRMLPARNRQQTVTMTVQGWHCSPRRRRDGKACGLRDKARGADMAARLSRARGRNSQRNARQRNGKEGGEGGRGRDFHRLPLYVAKICRLPYSVSGARGAQNVKRANQKLFDANRHKTSPVAFFGLWRPVGRVSFHKNGCFWRRDHGGALSHDSHKMRLNVASAPTSWVPA